MHKLEVKTCKLDSYFQKVFDMGNKVYDQNKL